MANFKYSHLYSTSAATIDGSLLNLGEIAITLVDGQEGILFKKTNDTVIKLGQTDLSDYWTSAETQSAITASAEAVVESIQDDAIGYAAYNSENKKIYFYTISDTEKTTPVAQIDATAFIKDGMLVGAEITDGTGDNEGKQVLKLTFNTDAGQDNIEVPIGDLFNAENYYTKTEVTNLLADKANTGDVYTKEEVYTKTEVNGLLGDKADADDVYTKDEVYNQTEIDDKLSDITDDINDVTGDVATLQDEVITGGTTEYKATTNDLTLTLAKEGTDDLEIDMNVIADASGVLIKKGHTGDIILSAGTF